MNRKSKKRILKRERDKKREAGKTKRKNTPSQSSIQRPSPPSGESHGERDHVHPSRYQRPVRRCSDGTARRTNLGTSTTSKTGPQGSAHKTVKKRKREAHRKNVRLRTINRRDKQNTNPPKHRASAEARKQKTIKYNVRRTNRQHINRKITRQLRKTFKRLCPYGPNTWRKEPTGDSGRHGSDQAVTGKDTQRRIRASSQTS